MSPAALYDEKYRPQFHFSARTNWLNDPNGCVFYAGEYHLLFQHNPEAAQWGNMTWGHAVSPDLVHWRELSHALRPYAGGTIFSGSAVVDWDNSSGLGEPSGPPLVAAFTHARSPFGQALAFSNDRGRSWKLHDSGQAVIPNQGLDDGERDPRLVWHEPSRSWGLVLWVKKGQARFFVSKDLIHWTHSGDFFGESFFECPDLFELAVDGAENDTRWILCDAAFNYWIGSYDGRAFHAESGPFPGDRGANFYAAQTWTNTGRRAVQIGWMRGGEYPSVPFNQQMSLPCELGLRKTMDGLRLVRTPVPEISALYERTAEFRDKALAPGQYLAAGSHGDLLDLQLEVELGAEAGFSLQICGQEIAWRRDQVTCLDRTAPLARGDGVIDLRLLVDRASIELFAERGLVSMSSCFLPTRNDAPIRCVAEGGPVRVRSLTIHALRSAWTRSGDA